MYNVILHLGINIHSAERTLADRLWAQSKKNLNRFF